MAQSIGGLEGIGRVRVRQDDGELVTADAEGTVTVAECVPDAVGHTHEETVAGRVSLAVVDLLEVVEVDEQERDWHLVTTLELQLAVKLLLERAVVAESGEAVVQRVLSRLAVELLELGLRSCQVVERLQERSHQDDGDEQHDDGEGRQGCRHEWLSRLGTTGQI